MIKRWENVTSDVTVELTDEMRDELGLFEDAEKLIIRVKSIDDDGNKTFEGEIMLDSDDTEPMSVEQIAIYTEN